MNIDKIINDYNDRFYSIPFDNSQVQNIIFLTGDVYSDTRKYRQLGLRLRDRVNAIAHLNFERRRQNVRIEELKFIIANDPNIFNKERAKIDLDEIAFSEEDTKKLLNDALVEIETLYNEIEKYPKFSRIDFENQEIQHFEKKLNVGNIFSKTLQKVKSIFLSDSKQIGNSIKFIEQPEISINTVLKLDSINTCKIV